MIQGFLCGAYELEQLQSDARDRVQWAAKPFDRNEQIKERIYRASDELRLPLYLIKKAWYGNIGPYQYPPIYNAWLELARRREAANPGTLGFTVYVNEQPIPELTRAEADLAKAIAGLRKAG